MGLGTNNQLYQWVEERKIWQQKATKKRLLSILALSKDEYDKGNGVNNCNTNTFVYYFA